MSNGARVVCPHCGANNFDTQAACWKCGVPLTAAPGVAAAQPRPPSPPGVAPASLPPLRHDAPPEPRPDPSVAIVSAVVLAVLFPYVAVCVGLVFLMLDDRRKADIGRVILILGLVLTVIQTVFFAWLYREAWDQIRGFVGSPNMSQMIDNARQSREPKATDNLPQGFPTP
jgi:hypothetical protein